MYVINNLFYGIDLNKKKHVDLLGYLQEVDFEIHTEIKKEDCWLDFPYHGGQVAGDVPSVFFGVCISDDDYGSNGKRTDIAKASINAVSKVDHYKDVFDEFLKHIFKQIDHAVNTTKPDQYWSQEDVEEYKQALLDFKVLLKGKEPEFYSVESSS